MPIIIPANEGETCLLFHFFMEGKEVSFTREVRTVIGWYTDEPIGDEILMLPLIAGFNRSNGLNRRIAILHANGGVSAGREDFDSLDDFIHASCKWYQSEVAEQQSTWNRGDSVSTH